jgi:hypothetical protein
MREDDNIALCGQNGHHIRIIKSLQNDVPCNGDVVVAFA